MKYIKITPDEVLATWNQIQEINPIAFNLESISRYFSENSVKSIDKRTFRRLAAFDLLVDKSNESSTLSDSDIHSFLSEWNCTYNGNNPPPFVIGDAKKVIESLYNYYFG